MSVAPLQWFILPAILMPDETYPDEVLQDGLMREMSRERWEYYEALERRAAFDQKHPRCEVCGQFIGSTSHFWQDYWGEWDHV